MLRPYELRQLNSLVRSAKTMYNDDRIEFYEERMAELDLVIQNGTIVTAGDVFDADVGIAGAKIVALGDKLTGRRALDAQGMYVLPGFVDAHVHMQLPIGDMVSADDFCSGTIAAACGGTTTILDFVTPERGQPLFEAVAARRAEADGRVAVDYALHLTAVDAAPPTLDALSALAGQGYTSLKMYTTYPALKVNDGEMLALLQTCQEQGILPLVHAENHHAIEYLRARLLAQGKTGPKWHPHSRPPLVEAEAVHRVLALAGLVDAPLYIVHLSCAESLAALQFARSRGQTAYAEVCTQHLLLSDQAYHLPDLEGANFVLAPPLRSASHQEALWHALAHGQLDVVSTDHCPWTREQRARGRDNWARIPNGMPGVETRMPLIFQEGVNAGRLSLRRMVDVCATTPARLMGLYPRKGTVAIGSDADLVLFDPSQEWTLRASQLHQNVDHCPYEGWRGRGYPHTVLLRGQIIVRDGRFVAQTARGTFIPRHRFEPDR
jgi:dihydropyrimidinase